MSESPVKYRRHGYLIAAYRYQDAIQATESALADSITTINFQREKIRQQQWQITTLQKQVADLMRDRPRLFDLLRELEESKPKSRLF